MARNKSNIETKVGIFVFLGVIGLCIGLLMVGGTGTFQRKNAYFSKFDTIDGLIAGSKVTINGLRVGSVTEIKFSPTNSQLRVDFEVPRQYERLITQNTFVEVATQGVLGDKFIALSNSDPSKESPPLVSGTEIPVRAGKDLAQFLTKSDLLMTNVNSIAVNIDQLLRDFQTENRSTRLFSGLAATSENLAKVSEAIREKTEEFKEFDVKSTSKKITSITVQLNGILEKVNNGNGTIGALLNDPSLYDDIRALTGGVNRNRIMRNLVRQTIRSGDEAKADHSAESPSDKENSAK